MRLKFDEREDFLDMVKMRFNILAPDIQLRIYGIPKDTLKEFKQNSSKKASTKYAFDNAPDDQYRLRNEEPLCANAVASKPKIVQVEQKPDNFVFENRSSLMMKDENIMDNLDGMDNLEDHINKMDFSEIDPKNAGKIDMSPSHRVSQMD